MGWIQEPVLEQAESLLSVTAQHKHLLISNG